MIEIEQINEDLKRSFELQIEASYLISKVLTRLRKKEKNEKRF